MNLFKSLGDPLNMMGGGLLWKPMKKATGLTDAQMIGLGAMAVAAPYALPAMGAMGGGAATLGSTAGATGSGLTLGGAGATGSGFALGGAGATGAGFAASTAPQAAAPGLLDTAMAYGKTALGGLKEYGPAGAQAVDAAYKANSMTQGQPMQAPPAQFQQGQGFAGLLNPTDQVDMEKRLRAQQMAVQGLLGGYRG